MKTPTVVLLSAAIAALVLVVPQAHAATPSSEGTLTDAMCIGKHMMPGKSDAECIKACAKAGSAYVLVVNDKTYTLTAKPQMLASFAGKHVLVHGVTTGTNITVVSIEEVKGTK